MEIDITEFFNSAEPFEFSASMAERGQNAGRETWRNAVAEGTDSPLLTTPEQIEALRQWAKESGGWDAAERAAWSDAECNALFIQLISGDMRELESLCMGDNGEIDWQEAEKLSHAGTIGGNLYRGDDGKVYYYLGS
jgi:hypothetical protein